MDAQFIGANADHATICERERGIAQQSDRLQHGIGEHRLEDVELQMSLARSDRNQRIVAEHLAANHGQSLGLGRVDFAGHNGRAGLVRGQDQLADSRAGS